MIADNNLWMGQDSRNTVKDSQNVILPLTNQRISGISQTVRSDVNRLAAHIGDDVFDALDALTSLVVHDGVYSSVSWGRRIGPDPQSFDNKRTLRI